MDILIQMLFVLSAMFCGLFFIRIFSIIARNPVDMPWGVTDGWFSYPALLFQIWYWTQPFFVGAGL